MSPLKNDNPLRTFPGATMAILGPNALVYLYEPGLGPHPQEFFFRCKAFPSGSAN